MQVIHEVADSNLATSNEESSRNQNMPRQMTDIKPLQNSPRKTGTFGGKNIIGPNDGMLIPPNVDMSKMDPNMMALMQY